MKNLIKYACIGLLTVGLLGVAGCVQGQSSHSNSDPVKNEAQENSQAFDGGKLSYSGSILTVTLDENQTTGYSWVSTIDGSALVSEGESALSEEGQGIKEDDAMLGQGGVRVFSYKGTVAGESRVVLTYERSWEKNSSDKQLVLRVTTERGGTIDSVEVQ